MNRTRTGRATQILFLVAAMCAFGQQVLAQSIVGVVQRQRGDASSSRIGATTALALGAAVFAGDVVRTGTDARIEIRLLDDSRFTLGENAEMAIDEMTFSPDASQGDVGRQALR